MTVILQQSQKVMLVKKYNKYCAANYTIIAKFVLLTKESKRHFLPKEPKKHYDK